MSLARYQLEDVQALRNRMNRLFEEGGRSVAEGMTGSPNGSGEEGAPRLWAPAVDVVETEREIVLHAELPGMRKEDIDIQITGDTLTLRGERQRADMQRSENFHRIERQYGAFGRTFEIETPIDASKVSASYENGVLTITLPKREEVRPRQIEIQVK